MPISTEHTQNPNSTQTTVHLQWIRDAQTTLKCTVNVIDPLVADVLKSYTLVQLPDNTVAVYQGQTCCAHSNGLNQGRKLKVVLRNLAFCLM